MGVYPRWSGQDLRGSGFRLLSLTSAVTVGPGFRPQTDLCTTHREIRDKQLLCNGRIRYEVMQLLSVC